MSKKQSLHQWISVFTLLFLSSNVFSKVEEYGKKICKQEGYQCITVKRGDSWSSLFPNFYQRDLVKRVNRMNGFLSVDTVLAVPEKLEKKNIFNVSPLPLKIEARSEPVLIIDQAQLAWGAYSETGLLKRWGPVSAGASHCFGAVKGCNTPTGHFYINRKQGVNCISRSYPKRVSGKNGGAPMPYCMFFFQGYAIHGSNSLPGYHASQGCVRMFVEDAKWLYFNFINPSINKGNKTRIIILPKSKPFTKLSKTFT